MPILRNVAMEDIAQTARQTAREIAALPIPPDKNLRILIGEDHNQIAQVVFQTEFLKEYHEAEPDAVFCDENGAFEDELPKWEAACGGDPLGFTSFIRYAAHNESCGSALRYAVVTDAKMAYIPSPDLKCDRYDSNKRSIIEDHSAMTLSLIESNPYFAKVAAEFPDAKNVCGLHPESQCGIIGRDMAMATKTHALPERSVSTVGLGHLGNPGSHSSLPALLSALDDVVVTIALHTSKYTFKDFDALTEMCANIQQIAPKNHAKHLDIILPYSDCLTNPYGDGIMYFHDLCERQRAPA